MTYPTDSLAARLDTLARAQTLKDTLRSGCTAGGRAESSAEHSWALCLLVLLNEPDLEAEGIDILQLLRLCILHDLGEAITGDIPAIEARPDNSKDAAERDGVQQILSPLPGLDRARLLAIWDVYAAGASPEAKAAKGLDKIETMTQHVNGAQKPGFDFCWNLGYGRHWTNQMPLLAALRQMIDAQSRQAQKDQANGQRP